MTRLTVRREQIDVMAAVAEANFERKIAMHLRESYSDSNVKLPDGGEFQVHDLLDPTLDDLVRVGISKARRFEITNQSSIAAFVALMFDVAPNFDKHRLCEVLLWDEEKTPNERVGELVNVLTEKHWESIRKDYDANAWIEQVEAAQTEPEQTSPAEEKAKAASVDPMAGTISGKTMSRTVSRKGQTLKIKPAPIGNDPAFDKTVRIDRKE